MINNTLKKDLKNGKKNIGTFVTCNAPDLVEILGLAGFDFIVIDTEHGAMTHESTQHLIRAAELRGITPIVRVPNHEESSILHILDVGAHGIQVPQVNTVDIAQKVIKRSKYAPIGNRGVAFTRSADYGFTDTDNYFDYENQQTLVVVHCENKECLENLEDICKLEDVDVIFLGPYDMSQSLGITGQVHHEKIKEVMKKVLEVTKKYNKAAGIFAGNGSIAREFADMGFQYITIGLDISLFSEKCKQEVSNFNNK